MGAAVTASVTAALAARAHRELLDHFRLAGATRPDVTVPLPDPARFGRRRLERWVRDEVVRAAPGGGGGYWLDEAALARAERERRRVARLVVLTLLALLAVAVATGAFASRALRVE